MPDLKLNYDLVKKFIVEFIREEVSSNGFKHGILGLSGGVDSALVAYLAVEALGNKNVKALLLPYRTSSPESRSDAMLVIENLGIEYDEIEITNIADAYFSSENIKNKLRIGNFLARIRMSVVFDKAAEFNAMVLGTSNKSELLLGYGTWHGDMAAGIYPIGDLYKTQVWELARFVGVPEKIVEKRPTADLWPGQTDESELGATYKNLDEVLNLYIDKRKTEDEILKLGFDEELVRNVFERVYKTQFKRTFPPVAKFSARTVGIDFLYPHDFKR